MTCSDVHSLFSLSLSLASVESIKVVFLFCTKFIWNMYAQALAPLFYVVLSVSTHFHYAESFLPPTARTATSPPQPKTRQSSSLPKQCRSSIIVNADARVSNQVDSKYYTNGTIEVEEEFSDEFNGATNVNRRLDLMQNEGNDFSNESDDSIVKRIFLGIDPTPDIVAIATIYFVEGALGLARLAQTFLLKDELKLGPAELSATLGLLSLPWTIKPLYGFLSDGFPIFGYRRRSYLVLAGFVGFLSYLVLALGLDTLISIDGIDTSMAFTVTVISLLLSSASIALSDVVADGIVVQKTREAAEQGDDTTAGGLQSLCWGSAALGALLSAYFSGSLLETMSPKDVFGIVSILPLAVSGISFLIQEEPIKKMSSGDIQSDTQNGKVFDEAETSAEPTISEQISSLSSALRQPSIYKPVLFLFLWKATPTSDGAMLYFMTNDIGFGPEFLGRARLLTAASSLLGVFLYNQYLRRVPIKDVLLWTSIVSVPLGLTQLLLISHYNRELGIPDGLFVLGDDAVLSILGEFAFLPTLVLAARLCPPGIEAVLFATLMSIYNGASTVGTEVGAGLTKLLSVTETDFSNLALLTLVCNLSSLLPLVFIGWLDGVGEESQEEMEARGLDTNDVQ